VCVFNKDVYCVCTYIALKEKLSNIPDQIRDRSTFLRIIRDVAGSIKEVLDAVNEVSKRHQADTSMKEHRKVIVEEGGRNASEASLL